MPGYCAQGAMISYSTVWPHLAIRAFALHIFCGRGCCGEFCFQELISYEEDGALVAVSIEGLGTDGSHTPPVMME